LSDKTECGRPRSAKRPSGKKRKVRGFSKNLDLRAGGKKKRRERGGEHLSEGSQAVLQRYDLLEKNGGFNPKKRVVARNVNPIDHKDKKREKKRMRMRKKGWQHRLEATGRKTAQKIAKRKKTTEGRRGENSFQFTPAKKGQRSQAKKIYGNKPDLTFCATSTQRLNAKPLQKGKIRS